MYWSSLKRGRATYIPRHYHSSTRIRQRGTDRRRGPAPRRYVELAVVEDQSGLCHGPLWLDPRIQEAKIPSQHKQGAL
jgi:hypothetical protein